MSDPGARLSWLVVTLSAALVGAGLFVADRSISQSADAPAARFVPPDGASWHTTERSNTSATPTHAVTESAIIVGSAITGALDWTLGTQVIGALEADSDRLARTRYWRTTTTILDQGRSAQATRVYSVGAEISLLVESGPTGAWVYRPNLVELPAGVAAGHTWASSGKANTSVNYTSRFAAEAADQGCLRVTGTITYSLEEKRVAQEVRRLWCPDQGLVEETATVGKEQLTAARTDPPAQPPVTTTDAPATWTPQRWTERTLESVSADPTFGKETVSGTPSSIPPLHLASGRLVRATTSGQDVLGFSPGEKQNEWQSRWRAHPGGTILTTTGFGRMWVTTTSHRQVVGYDDFGVRRWQLALDELVTKQPARASDTDLALVTVGGDVVVVEIATGRIRWQAKPGADVGVAPVVSRGVVVIADRDGALIGLDLADGTERWHNEAPEVAFLAVSGSQVLAAGPYDLDAFDLATGERSWRVGYTETAKGLIAFADWVLFLTGDGLRAYDGRGQTLWHRPGVYAVSSNATYLVCWGRRRAEVLDRSGRTVTSFAIPDQPVGNPHRFVAASDGVLLLDSTWQMRKWSDD